MRLTALLCLLSVAAALHASDLELTHARIYTAPGQPAILDGAILIHDGSITAVGPTATIKSSPAAAVIDCTGKTITAGFWNSHVHLITPRLLHAERSSPAALQAELETLFTRWGFTSVFDLASVLSNTNLIRRKIAQGDVHGPRILTVGEPFWADTPVYIKAFLAENQISMPEVHSAPEAVVRVDTEVHNGADAIKIFAGAIEAHDVLLMPASIATAIVKEAHHDGRLVFSHPSNQPGIELSLKAGVDVLAHCTSADGAWTPELIHRMRATDLTLIPTLTLFDVEERKGGASPEATKRVIDIAVFNLRAFYSAGGTILFGTDVGYTDHVDTAEEFTLMSQAGMSFPQILASLTTNPARRFGYSAHTGRITLGFDADLVVLQADPAADITALSRVAYTIRSGKVVYSAPEPPPPVGSKRRNPGRHATI